MITNWSTLARIDPGLAPDQFDVSLRPGTSPLRYAQALTSTLGPDYLVRLNSRKSNVVAAMIGLITALTLLLATVAALGLSLSSRMRRSVVVFSEQPRVWSAC
jgi:hypothetical protein